MSPAKINQYKNERCYLNVTYFISLTSQNWRDDSQVAATEFTSCGSQAPPDNLCSIPAESCDCTCVFLVHVYPHNHYHLQIQQAHITM